jgi:hypothetical protein
MKLTKPQLKAIVQEELQSVLALEEGWFGTPEESGKLGDVLEADLNALEARIEQLETLIKQFHGSELPAGKS